MQNLNISICDSCLHDCKMKELDKCINYLRTWTLKQYWEEIREHNINLRRLCNNYGLKYTYMMKMLDGKMQMKYKYHKVLMSRIYEVDEFIPYEERFDEEKEK